MSQEEENYVALFIDWDNLAISTSVDFGGAVPDVRAIVHAAQRFGTVLLARAYAEWNVSSDRLSVYRAGVEPVYAPTFRFEPEPGSQMPRGKSLADPCLVTDSIDIMHLMPNINVFCLVSGDKDLIPIVRLAQLRGKKVVVIGPDFVAAILREMADEYIPYRGLVEAAEAAGVAEVAAPSRPSRRLGGGNSRQPQLATGHTVRTSGQHQSRSSATPPVSRTAAEQPVAEPVAAPPPAPAAPAAPVPEVVAEVIPTEETVEAGPLFETIRTILREREQTGKPRLRATNLKDQLLARIPGFNERKYGFPRFKDLLTAAEKAGVLNVSRTGPVQWVTLATEGAPTETAASAPATVESAAPVTETPPAPPISAPTVEEPAAAEEPIDEEAIRFILDLRERSRWLTYTYVLTNLLNHLGKGSADAAADVAARSLLNRLVQSGILVVDREPHEIDVNGTKHRVRLCHVVDEHPAIAALLAEAKTEAATEQTEAPAPTESATSEAAPTPVFPVEATPLLAAPTAEPTLPEPTAPEAVPMPAAEAEAPVRAEATPTSAETEPAAAPAELPTIAAGADAEETVLEAAPLGQAEAARAETGSAESESAAVASGAAANGTVPNAPLTLPQSYEVLREVVREATGPNRPHTGPAAVKNRLVRRLGAFDEHAFGFSKFKDYLLAAEKAGAVKVEVVGTSARVSLPEG